MREKKCRHRVFPCQHLLEEPLVRLVTVRFLFKPLPNMRESTGAITATDESIGMIGNSLPLADQILGQLRNCLFRRQFDVDLPDHIVGAQHRAG